MTRDFLVQRTNEACVDRCMHNKGSFSGASKLAGVTYPFEYAFGHGHGVNVAASSNS